MPDHETLASVQTFLRSVPTKTPSTLTLQRSLSEAWFSNTLAWLLDPRGSHGFGVRFSGALTALLARKRSGIDGGRGCARRASFLKAGRAGLGVGSTGFRFANASVLREFYLSKSVRRDGRGGQYCDLVFLDLDRHDSFFLVIENKLFQPPSAEQLRGYQETVDEKYARTRVREFALVTLRPGDLTPVASEVARNWIHLSWTEDILGLLDTLAAPAVGASPRSAVASLRQLLAWLDAATDPARLSDDIREGFRNQLVRAAAECLLDELRRLHTEGGGEWRRHVDTGTAVTLRHSTRRVSSVVVTLLPGLSVVVQDRRGDGRGTFDKIIVPFGAEPAQVFNLLDLAARDIYRWHLPASRRGAARWRPVNRGKAKTRHAPLFQFVHRHHHALRVLLYRTFATPAP